jgi:hypothetical protein
VSTPSHPQAPGDPAGDAQPSTAEIPVVQPAAAPVTKQLPPHPGATSFAAHPATAPAVEAPQPTGPVDFVPGLPGLGTPPPPPPAPQPVVPPAGATPVPTWPDTLEGDEPARERSGTRGGRLPQDRSMLTGIGLAVLSLVLLQLGLVLDFGLESLWDAIPLWSAFATLAVLVGLVALLVSSSKSGRARADRAWGIGAAGLVGLAVFWLLIVLPGADSDRGFLLTAALGALGAALWIGAKRD